MVDVIQLKANEKGHSLLGPSGSSKWMNCPGAVHLEATLGEEEISEPAEEGTAAHYVGEQDLRGSPVPLGSKIRTEAGLTFEVTQEMLDAVKIYTDDVREGEVELGTNAGIEAWVELIPGLVSGTIDALIIGEDGVKVKDLKYGVGVEVDADWNSQLMIYALAVIAEMEKDAGSPLADDTEFELTIDQPRHFKDRKVKSWFTTAGQLRTWGEFELMPAVDAAVAATAEGPFVPGEKQCQWCKAARAGACPAIRKVGTAVGEAFAMELALSTAQPIEEYSPEQLAYVLEMRTAYRAWTKMVDGLFTAVSQRAKSLLEEGYTVPGFKRVAGRKSAPSWTASEEEVDALCSENMIDPYNRSLLSPAKVRDLFKAEGLEMDKIMAMMEAKQGESVVPESNKKKALPPKMTPEEVFSEVEVK